jgi:hypothetical protein
MSEPGQKTNINISTRGMQMQQFPNIIAGVRCLVSVFYLCEKIQQ